MPGGLDALEQPGDFIELPGWVAALDQARRRLAMRGAAVVGDERSSSEILERALVMLTLRRVVTAQAGGFHIDRGQDLLLRYYANSIAHFFEPPPQCVQARS